MDILAPYLYSPPFLLSQIRYIYSLYYIVSCLLHCSEKHLEVKSLGMQLRPYIYSAGWDVFDPFIQYTGFLTQSWIAFIVGQ
jgi:hypothetical protein